MAKAALEALALTLAKEERSNGIHVNVVAPGLVATEMGRRLVKAMGVDDIADSRRRLSVRPGVPSRGCRRSGQVLLLRRGRLHHRCTCSSWMGEAGPVSEALAPDAGGVS